MKLLKISLLSFMLGSSLFATELVKSCTGCHGLSFEKKALNNSIIVKGMPEEDIQKAMIGYKNKTYNLDKPMHGLMQVQVERFNEEELKEISKYISTL